MNIAFPAFLLLVILIPGVLFRTASLVSPAFRDRRSIADEFGLSVFAALCLHAVWYLLSNAVSGWTGVRVDLTSAIVLLAGRFGASDATFVRAVESVSHHVYAVAIYFVSLTLFAWLAGVFWRYLSGPVRLWKRVCANWVHNQRLFPNRLIPYPGGTGMSVFQLAQTIDHRDDFSTETSSRRFGQWLRSCELPPEEFEMIKAAGSDYVIRTIVGAVVELGGKPFLYRGFLDKAFFAPDGDLERVTLTRVMRRCITDEEVDIPGNTEETQEADDEARGQRYYSVSGDTFILRLPEVKTINFEHYVLLPPANNAE